MPTANTTVTSLMQDYRAEVRRNYEATEQIFAADMKWRDDWAEDQKKERRKERRRMARQGQDQPGNDVRLAPTEEHLPPDSFIGDSVAAVNERRLTQHSGAVVEGGGGKTPRLPPAVVGQANPERLTTEGDGEGLAISSSTEEAIGQSNDETALNTPILLPSPNPGLRGELGLSGASIYEADSLQEKTRGTCQGSCLVENMERCEEKQLLEEGQSGVRAEAVGLQPSLGQGMHAGEAVGGAATVSQREETDEAAV